MPQSIHAQEHHGSTRQRQRQSCPGSQGWVGGQASEFLGGCNHSEKLYERHHPAKECSAAAGGPFMAPELAWWKGQELGCTDMHKHRGMGLCLEMCLPHQPTPAVLR